MGALEDKVSRARRAATSGAVSTSARRTVDRYAKADKLNLTMAEERQAKKVITPRVTIDRKKTAARAVAIQKVQKKKTDAARMKSATGNK